MSPDSLKFLAVGMMAFSFIGASIGVAIIFKAMMDGIARNPSAESQLSKYVFIGAGLAESMGLFGLVVSLIIMFA